MTIHTESRELTDREILALHAINTYRGDWGKEPMYLEEFLELIDAYDRRLEHENSPPR